MADENKAQNKKLTDLGLVELEKKFNESLENPEDRELFLSALAEYVKVGKKEQYENLASYQRWYVSLVWPRLVRYEETEAREIFRNYFHIAILLGYDVWQDILWYILGKSFSVIEQVDFYTKLRLAIKFSDSIIAKMGNKNYVFADLLTLCKDKIQKGGDIEGLKILLRPVIFCEDIEKLDTYYVFDRDKILENYIKLIRNVLLIEGENILVELNKEVNPQLAPLLKTKEEYLALKEGLEMAKKPTKTAIPAVDKVQKTNTVAASPIAPPSYSEIKDKINQFFPKDQNGEIIDTEGVFEVLEKTAAKYGDEKIKELYYFDEASGKFKWGV